MNRVEDSIIERIKKLLELTTSPNEHEAALAMERAKNMMLKYSLTYDNLNADEFRQEIKEETYTSDLFGKPGIKDHVPTILATIPPIFGVHCLIASHRDSFGNVTRTFKMFGFEANIKIAKFAVDSLLNQGALESRAEYKKFKSITFSTGFWQGFTIGLTRKFGAQSNETGLTVYDKVKDHVKSMAKGSHKVDWVEGLAVEAGIEAGLRAQLRSALNNPNTGKLIT